MAEEEVPAFGVRKLELFGRSFYCRDGLLEIWLAVMADALDGAAEPWLSTLRDELSLQAQVKFNGLTTAELDGHLGSAARLSAFTALCQAVRGHLLDGAFTPGVLASRIGGDRWGAGMPARLVRIADAVLWLLQPEPQGMRT